MIWVHEENVSHLKNGQKDRETVLVYAGCHKKYHRLGDFNNRNLYSHGSRCYKFKIKMPAISVPSERFLLGLQTAAFCCVLICRGGMGAGSSSLVSLFKRILIIPFQSLIIMTSFYLCHFFTGSISKHSHIGGWSFITWIWGRDTIWSTAEILKNSESQKLKSLQTSPT